MNTQNKIRFASGGSITADTPKWLYCDCGLEFDIRVFGEIQLRACLSCRKIEYGDGNWKKLHKNYGKKQTLETRLIQEKWKNCERCGLENDVTENTYQGVVYQRVTKCPSCKYINFDNS